jgi:3-phosphoshikimate 1-carboxyvinyltransferase
VSSVRFEPPGSLRGTLRPPPDKSISHRAAIIGAMGEAEAEITGYLDAADTRSTLRAVELLGASVEGIEGGSIGATRGNSRRGAPNGGLDLSIRGVGLRGPGERVASGPAEIDVGNAGTLLRILPGWLAGQGGGEWTLDGDESIRRRPVDRVAEPLRLMGAEVECRDDRLPPLRVRGAELRAIEYRMPVASAQVKSCVLLAGLLAEGETTVVEPATTRDHTERMLRASGAAVEVEPLRTLAAVQGESRRIHVRAIDRLQPARIEIPGDFSSAAFVLAAALIVPGSEIRLEGVGLNPTRIGLLGVLTRMGAAIDVEEDVALGGEPRGAIVARHSRLAATRVTGGEVPLAIDELSLVGLLGCFAEGETVVSGAEELRHKESDRIAALVEGLRGTGADIEGTDDGFVVTGTGGLRGGILDARGDHRMAMLGAIAGLASREGVEVSRMEAAAVSYPSFEADLASLLG